MSARDVYEAVLVEMNKEQAPNILLEDFNYFFNKAINQYINKRYNIYDINLLTTDDLRVLKSTAFIAVNNPEPLDIGSGYGTSGPHNGIKSLNATYRVKLPDDYLHMLNCICVYNVTDYWRCYDPGDSFEYPATRLTADLWGLVINNFWIKPTYRRPYYYIHNMSEAESIALGSSDDSVVTNAYLPKYDGQGNIIIDSQTGEPQYEFKKVSGSSLDERNSKKIADNRYGNHSKVYCEIRYGTDKDTFKLKGVYIDYIKAPKFIRLTQKQVDTVQDTSLILEFPDYVCLEIINELVHILMENLEMLRIQTHPVVSLSIANPTQQLAPEQ